MQPVQKPKPTPTRIYQDTHYLLDERSNMNAKGSINNVHDTTAAEDNQVGIKAAVKLLTTSGKS